MPPGHFKADKLRKGRSQERPFSVARLTSSAARGLTAALNPLIPLTDQS